MSRKNEASTRRQFLGGIGLAAGATLLGGCTGGKTKNTSAANAKVTLPTYVPYRGVTPDLAGSTAGVMPTFLRYPATPVPATHGKPGNGGTINGLTLINTALPPPLSRNRYLQGLNGRLGVDLKLTSVLSTDYATKFATTIASGDLPDLLNLDGSSKDLPELLAASCADLTEFLSGDAAKDYPFLANIPPQTWKSAVYNGGIYGIAVPRSVVNGQIMFRRDDILRSKGLDPNPGTFKEFHQLCKELTDTRHNKWALGTAPTFFIQEMLRVPNGWRNDGGKLTNANEVPETKEAIGACAQLIKEGLVHPDSFDAPNSAWKLWFNGGAVALVGDTVSAWPQYYQQNTVGSSFDINGIVPPGYSGGKGVHWRGSGVELVTAFKKADKSRIKELLRICNWLAAPFGTEEYLYTKYGIRGVDYEMDHGNPILTQTGKSETTAPLKYVADAPQIIYFPGQEQVARAEYNFQRKVTPVSIENPVVGHYSNTSAAKGPTINSKLSDAQNDILQGRKPLSSWDDAVRTWRQSGGDQIRKEYEEALQHS